jgi:acetyl-CoA carboxylase alpha subunit/acetyl-CoA carboxylase beta subunit
VKQAHNAAEMLLDAGSFQPEADGLVTRDPLRYPGYERLDRESVAAGPATVGTIEVEAGVFDFSVLGGSLGEVAGERLARGLERAATRGVPFVLVTATGGARMQEGMISLVQMPKLVAARAELGVAHCPLVAVFGHPTTGGVLASLGALADVTIAVEGAIVGFAGPRIAQRVTGTPVPMGSHSAQSALANGLVDDVVPEEEVRASVWHALRVLASDRPEPVEASAADPPSKPDAWGAVESVRSAERPRSVDLLAEFPDSSFSLRGDRAGGNDPGVATALVRIAGRRAVVIALDHKHDPGPAAYRKSRRALAIAGRLDLPVVTLVDTRGADPSAASEAAGIAWEIAATYEAMLNAPVPILSVITGEGGSGGALAFAIADVLLAYTDSIFSVISVEAAAEILWRDAARAEDAARLLKVTAHDLVELGIADALVAEPLDALSLAELTADGVNRVERAANRRRRWRHRVGA